MDMTNPESGFVEDSLLSPGVVFQVKQSKYDKGYIITSLEFARNLFFRQGEISSLELRFKPGVDIDAMQKEIEGVVGKKYKVLNRYEQQADTFKIMQIEKLFAYVFLTFILIVACFNIIGSLSMLIIDKKNDVNTLRNLGANNKQIASIFLFEGRMISVAGAVIGIAIGLLLCWLQQTYGLVRLGKLERIVHYRRLPHQRAPLRHRPYLRDSDCGRMAGRVVSCEIHDKTTAVNIIKVRPDA